MDLLSLIVPVQGDADVVFAIPSGSYFIVFFHYCLEMERMFLANISDTEIIHYERELNGALVTFPEAWSHFDLSVDMLVESFFKDLVG